MLATSYSGLNQAFRKGFVSQLRPKMLFAIILPFLVALMSAIFLLSFAWSPLDNWFYESASSWRWFQAASSHLSGWGFNTMSGWLAGLFSFIALCAISGIIGLAFASIVIMPMALKQLSQFNYPDLERKGVNATTTSITNAIKVSSIFIIGWLLTLPLWFIPFMPIVLSLFWGAYAFSHMSRLDAIVEHATPQERSFILKKHNKGFWLIGLICAAIALIPPFSLIMPVYSILVCTHYGLNALQETRKQKLLSDSQTTTGQA